MFWLLFHVVFWLLGSIICYLLDLFHFCFWFLFSVFGPPHLALKPSLFVLFFCFGFFVLEGRTYCFPLKRGMFAYF